MDLLVRRGFFKAHSVVMRQLRKGYATLAQISISSRKVRELRGRGSSKTQVDRVGPRMSARRAWTRGGMLKRNDFKVTVIWVGAIGGEDGGGRCHAMMGGERAA